MSWYPPIIYVLITLLGAAVPAGIGYLTWKRRGKPGATALTGLIWLFALWGFLYAVELGAWSSSVVNVLYETRAIVFLAVAPLWSIFVLQYTGREGWLTWPLKALLFAVPLATLVLIFTNEDHGLVWTYEGVREEGPLLLANFAYGSWFWVDFFYATLLMLAGVTLLGLMLIRSQRLYAKQSVSLLLGVAGPWFAYASYMLGFDSGVGALPGLNPAILTFVPAGLALAWGLYRYRLLDISPVAHDTVVEGMSDGTMVLDARGRIVDLNPSAARILRCKPAEVVGESFRETMSKKGKATPMRSDLGNALLQRYEKSGHANEEITLGEGEDLRHYDLALSGLYDGRGKRTGHLVVLHEVTEKRLAVERLDRMAHYDALTGLPNRTLFHERLSQEVARTRRAAGKGQLALMFLDLDRFKTINDTLGHEVGDLLLIETARRLKASVREYDIVARLAGDEFTVILPEIQSIRDATEVAGRIVKSIAEPFLLDDNELVITSSVGICFHPANGNDPATLIKNADAAMYRAKASGKNRYEVFDEDALHSPSRHFEIENDLNRAIEQNQFVLYYQPEIHIDTSRMVGVETLVRWEHPTRGLIHPKDFIGAAEETGLIFAIERWVLREACRQMRSWQERYPTDTPLTTSVNLSSRHFMHPNLPSVVHHVLEETGLSPEHLVLEIKESTLNEDAMSATATLQALKKLGVGLTVDNFGAASSSLTQLRRFPLDTLKIDASFISALHNSEEDRDLVSAIITLAHALGLKAAAEGIETPRQLMQLRDMGCDIAQGHYFSESLSYRAASAFLVADLYY